MFLSAPGINLLPQTTKANMRSAAGAYRARSVPEVEAELD